MNFTGVHMMGRLTRDVELRSTGKGQVANFTVAVNKTFKDAAGEQREHVSFFDCAAFGPKATTISRHFAKGRAIFVAGELKQERWEGQDGKQHAKVKVIVDQFRFIDRKEDAATPEQPAGDELPF